MQSQLGGAFAVLGLFCPCICAQPGDIVEVTETDFVQLEQIDASKLSTFGIRIGQTQEEMLRSFYKYEKELNLKPRPKISPSDGSFSVEIVNQETRLMITVRFSGERVSKIEWGPPLQSHLVGDSRLLFDPAIATTDSELRLRLLGREDSVTDQGNKSQFIRQRDIVYLYDKEGIRIVWTEYQDIAGTRGAFVSVELVQPARPRKQSAR